MFFTMTNGSTPSQSNAPKQKSFASNVLLILVAQVAVKVLGMLYRMVITNIDGFGDAGNGFYSAGYQVYILLLAISSVGIPNAIAKLISEKAALSDYTSVNKIFRTALCIFAGIGAVLSAALFLLADPIAHYVLHLDGASYTLAALAPSIFFVCVSSVFRGYFSGTNQMRIMSSSQVIEQAFKSTLTIVFVLAAVGMAPEIMSSYANFATTVATVCGALYLALAYLRRKNTFPQAPKAGIKKDFFPTAKKILALAVPISLCSVISAVNRMVDTATITRGIERAFAGGIPAHGSVEAIANPTAAELNAEAVRLAGMLSKSDTLINLPIAMNVAFATVLVPSIAKCLVSGKRKEAAEYITSSFLTSVVLILPCAAGYILLGQPIYKLLYPNAPLGYELLQLSSISLIFMALNQTITGSLQGMGKVHIPALALLCGCIVKFTANTFLIRIPQINIYGATMGSILCQSTVFAIELTCLLRSIKTPLSLRKILFKPLGATLFMGIVTYFSYTGIHALVHSNLIAIFASVVLSAAVYGVLLLVFHVYTTEQLIKAPVIGKVFRKLFAKKA